LSERQRVEIALAFALRLIPSSCAQSQDLICAQPQDPSHPARTKRSDFQMIKTDFHYFTDVLTGVTMSVQRLRRPVRAD
jgi:hypothetical protein